MKSLFKTTVAAFALFATTAAFALEQNVREVNTDTKIVKDTAGVEFPVDLRAYASGGSNVFVQVSFTSSISADSFVITAPDSVGFVTNGGNVYFSNAYPDTALLNFSVKALADTVTDADSFAVTCSVGIVKWMSQNGTVFVSATESFGKFGVDTFIAKPKVWGEVVVGQKNGKDKIKKLSATVNEKVSKRAPVAVVSAIVKGTTPIFDKKLLAKEVYGKGLSLIDIETDTGITADSFVFEPAIIGQEPVVVTVKTSSNLPKGATKEEKKAAKNIEVVQYTLAAPVVMTDSLLTVNVDSTAMIVADTATTVDSFAMPAITENEVFTLRFFDLGEKVIVKNGTAKISAKVKVWVESLPAAKKPVVKKVAVKLDFKTAKIDPETGIVFIEGKIKKFPKNFVPATAGDVTSLVIETPTGVDATPVVIK